MILMVTAAQQRAIDNVNKAAREREAEDLGKNVNAAVNNRDARKGTSGPITPGGQVKDAIGNWLHRGAENFRNNMNQPIVDRPEPRRGKGRRPSRSDDGPFINIPRDAGLNFGAMDLGGGLDLDLHPDPMYHGMGGRKRSHSGREGAKRVTVTTRTYHYD